ncbi:MULTISPECIES: zinc ribbon domain-containing protein [Ramlibacter]|uniref:Serine endopeptidase n=1 Tax=Ramlibacter aquaticus TaxID=2780094 RepID=A0ABR9SCF0_9BURK|nr:MULTISPECIES: zinc ribbon domain-containing protein [Ramlibacter]MBE7939742.1 serine endopeptidase [Ramlibacter aquaticus]
MDKTLRLSEAWYRRGLWVVALVFAGFLSGLGSAVMRDLPKAEPGRDWAHYMDPARSKAFADRIRANATAVDQAQAAAEQARLQLRVAHADTQAASDSLNRWLATRQATQLATQDPELVARTRALDGLRQAEREAQARVQQREQALLDAQQARQAAEREQREAERLAREAQQSDARRVELTVFLYRLAFTLPLLLAGVWVFRRWRKGSWWPFAWGFVLFSVFTFFVELVPYLPSYGGYVRNGVGVLLTVVAGRWAMRALNTWLERQRAAEALPDSQRREALAYDTALARLAKGVCPGCERPVDMRDERLDYCPHCGIGLHDRCTQCASRKNAFARYCMRCGAQAHGVGAVPPPAQAPLPAGRVRPAAGPADGAAGALGRPPGDPAPA